MLTLYASIMIICYPLVQIVLTSLDNLVGQLAKLTDDFAQNLTDLQVKKQQLQYSSMISPTKEQYIAVELNHIPLDIVAKLPISCDQWLRVLPNTVRGAFLRFYFASFGVAVSRQTDQKTLNKILAAAYGSLGRLAMI